MGSVLFMMTCYSSRLYIQAALYFFYVIIAVIGFLYWRSNEELPLAKLSLKQQLIFLLGSATFGLFLGWLTSSYTDQSQPYLDGLISAFAVGATILMIMKFKENWIYWIFINASSIYLYFVQDLYFLTALSIVLLVFATYGLRTWYLNQEENKEISEI